MPERVAMQLMAAYGIQMRDGRDFDASDVANARPVAIVNEAFARRFFSGAPAIGRTYSSVDGGMTTIIGLVSDAAYNSMREPAPPTSYVHLGLAPVSLTISVHVASGHSARVAGAVAKTLTTLNPDLAFSFRTLDDQVSSTLTQDRVLAMLSGFFGSLALLIAALGIYGVAADASHDAAPKSASVWRSAPRRSPWSAWLCHAWPLVAVGVLAGAAFSLWASQFIGALLYGLTPRDPMTLAGAATVLAMVAAVAASVPAWRASRIDPAEVLRDS